ncbi:MAG: archaeal flagellar protein FlaJ [Thermoplasmata archaeon]|jgi:flagellar protein FlaJ|nr:archaeal flagellar protein FlaJ [Thermoplasmata archaeon]
MATVTFAPRKRFVLDGRPIAISLGLAAGAAVMLSGALTLAGRIGARPTRGLDLIALGFLLAASPLAFVVWAKRRRARGMDERLPDFLTDVASLHKAGLPLQESVTAAAEGSYGPLDPAVRAAADQVRWNLPVLAVLENLRRRIGTPLATRTFTVVIEAGRTGGNVPEVLEIAAQNARATVQMKQQRARAMSLYTIITYVASLVFVGVALAMQTVFVPRMIAAFGATGSAGHGIGLASALPDADSFRTMFYVGALVQAAGNGIIGGVMSEGSPGAGLRHSCVMVAICAAGFAIVG